MKISHRLVLAVMLLSGAWCIVQANDRGPDHRKNIEVRSERQLERMTKNLKLTPDQQSKVKAALDERNEKMKEIHKECGEKMKAVHEETDSKISAVLTPDQKTKFDRMREEMKKRHDERGHGPNG